jgi:hypothetical protein
MEHRGRVQGSGFGVQGSNETGFRRAIYLHVLHALHGEKGGGSFSLQPVFLTMKIMKSMKKKSV